MKMSDKKEMQESSLSALTWSSMQCTALTAGAALILMPLAIEQIGHPRMLPVPVMWPVPLVVLLYLGIPAWLVGGLVSVAFLLWCHPCLRGLPVPFKRSALACFAVGFLSLLYHVYELARYRDQTILLGGAVNFACALLIELLLLRSRRRDSVVASVVTNFLIFAWSSTIAFPWYFYP